MTLPLKKPTCVLLLGFGGPERAADVRNFLQRLFSDPYLMPLPGGTIGRFLFSRLIPWFRAPAVSKRYQAAGAFGSYNRWTAQQAALVQKTLAREEFSLPVYLGMRYQTPGIRETIALAYQDGCREFIVIPLFAHYSISTTGSVLAEAAMALAKPLRAECCFHTIPHWHTEPSYLQSWVERIEQQLATLPLEERATTPLLFSAHGIPQAFVSEQQDPYPEQIEANVKTVLQKLNLQNPWRLAYQGQIGRIPWTEPSIAETLRQLGGVGHRRVVLVPISFLCDHLETLYELDQLYRPVAEKAGIHHLHRVAPLNDSPHLTNALVALIREKMQEVALCP